MERIGKNSKPNSASADQRPVWRGLSIALFIFLSLMAHLVVFIFIAAMEPRPAPKKVKENTSVVTFKAVSKSAQQPLPPPPSPEEPTHQPILETPLLKTEKPEKADFLGAVDHRTLHEQKVAEKKRQITKNQDPSRHPGSAKAAAKTPKPLILASPALTLSPKKSKKTKTSKALVGRHKRQEKARNPYEQLLQSAQQTTLQEEFDRGYVDAVEGKFKEGEYIDLNTQEYRFIGYFTGMRKAIELAWNYPKAAAVDGIYGKVGIAFTILKDGKVEKVEIINTSGYQVLDIAIVDAIKDAAPFAPLPEGFGKTNLNISGTFSYVLR